ncbi:hypothetical protein RYZ26_16750 [Terasakiella sp. A23]|uniref:hypothetical protein n=1 Tax=Terasakiella sp. FCG-A23 TaxID=3080561 RepID=UPI002953D9BA|nr:hypothetical protein [Terasakiella sp. A23]MDV7341260.1 hypothetical protein [Terasakiella sp. A23]
MSILFRKFASYAVQKIASDPVARQQAADAAQRAAKEVKNIASADDRAYEAGRTVKRMLTSFSDNK